MIIATRRDRNDKFVTLFGRGTNKSEKKKIDGAGTYAKHCIGFKKKKIGEDRG
jgi:hypothetical protein